MSSAWYSPICHWRVRNQSGSYTRALVVLDICASRQRVSRRCQEVIDGTPGGGTGAGGGGGSGGRGGCGGRGGGCGGSGGSPGPPPPGWCARPGAGAAAAMGRGAGVGELMVSPLSAGEWR